MTSKEKAGLIATAVFVPMGTLIAAAYILGRRKNDKSQQSERQGDEKSGQEAEGAKVIQPGDSMASADPGTEES
jgi:hypothetical protein